MMELSFSEHIVWHANICKCYFGKSAHYIANYPCIPDGQPFNLLWRSIQIKASFNLLYLTFNAFLCMIRILTQVLPCILDLHFSTRFLRLYQTTTGFNRFLLHTLLRMISASSIKKVATRPIYFVYYLINSLLGLRSNRCSFLHVVAASESRQPRVYILLMLFPTIVWGYMLYLE
jgi:hypothetical protein